MTRELQLKYPVVLIQGFGATGKIGPFDYFFGLPARLRAHSNQLLIPTLTPFQTIEHRAEQLGRQIDQKFPEGKLNLIGHSMGGLVARFLAAQPAFSDRIASVTTIGTPNAGSPLGNLAYGSLPTPAIALLDRLLGIVDSNTTGLMQLGTQYMQDVFPELAPKMPDVAYFSATTAIREASYTYSLPIFWPTHPLLMQSEGDNDGFVSVKSATFGEHIATEYGDHYAQIGQILGRTRGLDYLGFQDRIIKKLKLEGF